MALVFYSVGFDFAETQRLEQLLFQHQSELHSEWIALNDHQHAKLPSLAPHVIVFSNSNEGMQAYQKFQNTSCFFVCAPSLSHSAKPPKEVSYKLTRPFSGPSLVQILNGVTEQLHQLRQNKHHSISFKEELIDLKTSFNHVNRIPSILVYLYAIFQTPQPHMVYRIRRSSSKISDTFDIFCFSDRRQIASSLLLPDLLKILMAAENFNAKYELSRIQPQDRLLFEMHHAPTLRNAHDLLWPLGFHAFKTSEVLPWFNPEEPFTLDYWPDLPQSQREPLVMDILSRLCGRSANLAQLMNDLKIKRRDACSILNALIVLGVIRKQPLSNSNPSNFHPPWNYEYLDLIRSRT